MSCASERREEIPEKESWKGTECFYEVVEDCRAVGVLARLCLAAKMMLSVLPWGRNNIEIQEGFLQPESSVKWFFAIMESKEIPR